MDNQTNENEEILFQSIMISASYRRGMIIRRVSIIAVIAGGFASLAVLSIVLGALLAAMVLFVGTIFVLAALGNEQTYTVYNTRVVIKRRGDDKYISVPVDSIISVKTKTAFYEKDLHTATVYFTAKNDKGKVKRYRLRHVLDYKPTVKFLQGVIDGRSGNAD